MLTFKSRSPKLTSAKGKDQGSKGHKYTHTHPPSSFFFWAKMGKCIRLFILPSEKPNWAAGGCANLHRFHTIFCELQGFCRGLGHGDSYFSGTPKVCMYAGGAALSCQHRLPSLLGHPKLPPITAGSLTTRELCRAKAQRQLKPQDHGQESLGGLRLLLLQLLL